jgi:hypothetical protein
MKKQIDRDLLPEYNFTGGVRGKYVSRLATGSNVAVLDKDVQKLFPNSVAVNAALRALGKAVDVVQGSSGVSRHSSRSRVRATRTG